jgi:pimeloyl-ACP methyl ester carboxylesterase
MIRQFSRLILAVIVLATACDMMIEGGPLSRAQAEEVAAREWQTRLTDIEAGFGTMWNAQLLELRDLRMPLFTAIYGEAPSDGRSLYISMHGGGATDPATNDEQWENQKSLYNPTEGVYVAPRAAVDDWNMWFRPFVDTLFEAIIHITVARYGVNPGKVYLMGYSAGGDGAYRLAARMADRWAAVAMMAGHPGETSTLNLRNVGFTLWMGELDDAFNRNESARNFSARLDSLQMYDPAGYPHLLNVIEGAGHWMNNADTLAIAWISRFRRNPYPDRVVWRQEESALRQHFYWLAVPLADARAGMQVIVERRADTIDIVRCDYPTLFIDLNDRMLDLDMPVTVMREGRQIFRGIVHRRRWHIEDSARERSDPDYIFSARLEITPQGPRVL